MKRKLNNIYYLQFDNMKSGTSFRYIKYVYKWLVNNVEKGFEGIKLYVINPLSDNLNYSIVGYDNIVDYIKDVYSKQAHISRRKLD